MALASTHVPGPVTVDTVLRLPLQARVRHPLYWRWIRFLIFGRAVPAVLFAASLLSIAAFAFALYAMSYLRRSLSIIPEARRLVTGGPYRIVRHPLYLAEVTAALSLVLAAPYLTPSLSLVVFILLQGTRA